MRKTQPRTPKMIRRRPTLQRLCPPISMGSTVVPPTNGAADPYGPAQGACGWVWRRDGWFACLGRRK
jgi:hypothetical protein